MILKSLLLIFFICYFLNVFGKGGIGRRFSNMDWDMLLAIAFFIILYLCGAFKGLIPDVF